MSLAYHRDDLRAELVDAACNFIFREGHDGLSVRKLAQLVNVSSGAPYRHFRDRRGLLIAAACRGFNQLYDATSQSMMDKSDPVSRIVSASHAFLDFVEADPNMFELMYDSELTRPTLHPELEQQYRRAYAPILDDLSAIVGSIDEGKVRLRLYFSTIFGFAFLSRRGGQFAFSVSETVPIRQRVIEAAIGPLKDGIERG